MPGPTRLKLTGVRLVGPPEFEKPLTDQPDAPLGEITVCGTHYLRGHTVYRDGADI